MPNNQKNRNTGRKHVVAKDDLQIKGPGLYAFMPFDNIDSKRRAVIKIGESGDLARRSQDYTSYFPNGVYMLAFLTDIKGPRLTRSQKPPRPHKLREDIEEYIIRYIATHDGGKRLYSTDRVRRPNGTLEGETEWVYSRVENVHAAFESAAREFNANHHLFYLQGLNPDTNKLEDVLRKTVTAPRYTGKIIFHVG
jgi:hypothetical protein